MKRNSGTIAAAIVGLAVLVGMATPAGALGADGHPRLWKACLTGSSAGQCVAPLGMATDEATGNLYVADRFNQRIDELSPWGEFVKAWGWGVRTGAAELQTCTRTTGCLEGSEGSGDGQLEERLGVAVDSHGDVFVTNVSNHRVQKFDPDGGPGGDAKFLLMFGGEVNQSKKERTRHVRSRTQPLHRDLDRRVSGGHDRDGRGRVRAMARGRKLHRCRPQRRRLRRR